MIDTESKPKIKPEREEPVEQLELDDGQQGPLFTSKWPSAVFSLFHPFNMSDTIDLNLKEYFDISMPFLNFKLGVQGANRAMSFCASEEDQNYNRDKVNLAKTIALLKLSQFS